MKRVLLQPAYVLHRRDYRETSFLVDLFTPEYGRISGIARGVRKARSSSQGLLQPFTPLLVSWSGRGELMLLTQIEANGEMIRLQGESLFAGFYLNELLVTLLQKWDAHPGIFMAYTKTIRALHDAPLQESVLRSFEKQLLEDLGYGLLPKTDISLHNTFSPDAHYRFVPEQGFVECERGAEVQAMSNVFSGKSLHAIAREDWQDKTSLQDAKRLIRFVLAPLLGARQIYSRKLFTSSSKEE